MPTCMNFVVNKVVSMAINQKRRNKSTNCSITSMARCSLDKKGGKFYDGTKVNNFDVCLMSSNTGSNHFRTLELSSLAESKRQSYSVLNVCCFSLIINALNLSFISTDSEHHSNSWYWARESSVFLCSKKKKPIENQVRNCWSLIIFYCLTNR